MPQNAAGRLVEGVEDPVPAPMYTCPPTTVGLAKRRAAGCPGMVGGAGIQRQTRVTVGAAAGVIAVAAEFSEEWAGPFR